MSTGKRRLMRVSGERPGNAAPAIQGRDVISEKNHDSQLLSQWAGVLPIAT